MTDKLRMELIELYKVIFEEYKSAYHVSMAIGRDGDVGILVHENANYPLKPTKSHLRVYEKYAD